MSFTAGTFLLFFPIVVLIYFIIPKRFQYIWLLLSSYYFYMGWNAKYIILIFISTVITYLCGIAIEKIKRSNYDENKKILLKKLSVALCLISNLGILGYFKYTQFFFDLIFNSLSRIGITVTYHNFDILLPVGISFYTFQALGYTIDVYRDDIYAEKNFLKYALFVSFFPQLVAGPIERSKNLLIQLNDEHKFVYDNFVRGFITMLWGYFLKIVMADRIAILVDNIYGNSESYEGWYFTVATVLFAIQIYCDFNGYTMIARGAAKIMGFNLIENFDAPFLSTSIALLWRRWHVSLTSWFKDYLYIPLGGSRKGKLKKYRNLMIVNLASGLWHGAALTYVAWGGLNGLFQIIGELLLPIRKKIRTIVGIDENTLSTKIIQTLFTFSLFNVSLVFFRSKSLTEACFILKEIFTAKNPWIFSDMSLYTFGLNSRQFGLMMITIIVLLLVDIAKVKRIDLYAIFKKQNWWFRCTFVALFITVILLFGLYGPSYSEANFVYFQF